VFENAFGLAVKPSDTFGRYCLDYSEGITNLSPIEVLRNGTVANSWQSYHISPQNTLTLHPVYTVEQLISFDLWERLESYRVEFGCTKAATCYPSSCPYGTMNCAYCLS